VVCGPVGGHAQIFADPQVRHLQNAPFQRMQTKDGYLMVGAAARQSRRSRLCLVQETGEAFECN
jgi:hypothetical protein